MVREELIQIAKPILFNTDMVRAILDGRKTVTRRVIKRDISNQFDCESDGTAIAYIDQETGDSYKPWEVCRFKKGDYLYVRETWDYLEGWKIGDPSIVGKYFYRADGDFRPCSWKSNWRPSIHMPKEAARIFLKVTNVLVERLQDIDDDGVVSEGLEIGAPFDELWDRTIKKSDLDRYGWDVNPWVFVIEFERIGV